jgi:hypothetical protein
MEYLDKEIENLVTKFQMTYIEAVCHIAEKINVDVELLRTKLSAPIIAKITQEANNNNLLKKRYETLPF